MPAKHFHIILAEDHQVVRNGIRSLLEKQTDMTITGEAMNGMQVLELLERGVEADLVITDVNMPGMDGLQMLQHLKSINPGVKVLVLSMLESDKYVTRAFNAGASAYLLKNISSQELIFAIRQVGAGEEYICSEIAMRLVKRMANAPLLPDMDNTFDLELSDRDTEILHLIAEGYTNQEIADKLFAGKRTIEGYRQNLMNKTGARNTAALIKFAIVNRLID